MKPGNFLTGETLKGYGGHILEVFEDIDEPWCGLLLEFTPVSDVKHYNELKVLLSSHGGIIKKALLTDEELKDFVHVLCETW